MGELGPTHVIPAFNWVGITLPQRSQAHWHAIRIAAGGLGVRLSNTLVLAVELGGISPIVIPPRQATGFYQLRSACPNPNALDRGRIAVPRDSIGQL